MFNKLCIAAALLATALAEPPVNNGYLPPPSSGYDYPRPQQPFPAPAPRPPAPTYGPPAPRPPAPTYGPPAPRPPAPTYGPPAPRPPAPTYGPPAPRPPAPTYGPPAPRPPAPTYGPPASRPPAPTYGPPAPQPPRPSYGPPLTGGGSLPGSLPPPSYRPTGPTGPFGDVPSSGQGQDHGDHHHHVPGMPFDFNYAVKDDYYGTDYSHNAISDGDVVRGEYKVLLPDGRLQIVSYTADWKNGYNAEVKYQGEPQYPQQTGGGARPGSYNAPSGGY